MANVTANQVYRRVFEFERDLGGSRFNLNEFEGAPRYIQDKLKYFNVKLLQLAVSVGRFREQIPSKFRYE